MSTLRLIGNTICPYCQRARILLEDSRIEHEWVELDFTEKPDWFVALTPVGKVPLLSQGDTHVFESAAIVEFINELTMQRYLPTDLLHRAKTRSWALYADRIHEDLRTYFTARNEVDMHAAKQRVTERLAHLDAVDSSLVVTDTGLTLAGAYMAPLFILLKGLAYASEGLVTVGSAASRLSAKLLSLPAVQYIDSSAYRERLLRFVLAPDTAYARARKAAGAGPDAVADGDAERRSAQYLTQSN